MILFFVVRNLAGNLYIGYKFKLLTFLFLFVISSTYFYLTKFKKYWILASGILLLISFYTVYRVDYFLLQHSIKKHGSCPKVAVFFEKRIKGKSGTVGFFKIKSSKVIKRSITGKWSENLHIGDTVIFLESIKFKGQYDVLNYFPTSEEIKKAKAHKYYYKGEYVDTIP